MKVLLLLTILLIFGTSFQISLPSSPSYEAGVVEFNYEREPSITQYSRTASNLANYLEIMRTAPMTLDIIVFPEMTLNQMQTAVEIPEPKDKVSPCDSVDYLEDNLVKQISCSAKMYQRYVVVGVVTKVYCPDEDMIEQNDQRNCSDREDRMSYYNTNVVFDRNGMVVSRYRKFNLFGEDVDRPLVPTLAVFETDFGVRFGHFICFDILFRYPALELIRSENITDIIYPTMWYSEMPFLTAVQVQHSWAYTNNINLLAAGANNPLIGSTGTGIFAGRRGSLISIMEGMNTTNLYTAIVPKIGLGDQIPVTESSVERGREEVAVMALNRENLENYTVQFLHYPSSTGSTYFMTLCHDENYCCKFVYGFEKLSTEEMSYIYAAVVFHGIRIMDGSGYGVTVCAVIACQTYDKSTCGVRNESLSFDHDWHTLEITGQFPIGDQYIYFPTTLDSSIMPLKINQFGVTKALLSSDSSIMEYSMKSRGKIREFYTFGIYGRDFSLDGTNGSEIVKGSFFSIVVGLTVTAVEYWITERTV
ncbi:vanin-like protein 2 [Bradysia coprophila]|uniref:vanin-like protein 2 n=1 Tax=Bradysia coprophila TaxID=38358 RepID=UPI00187DB118|nr:vanin-like protein 2 [Bradysia coprophila]